MTSDLSIDSGVKVNIILSGNNAQFFYRQNAGGSDNTVLSFDWGGGYPIVHFKAELSEKGDLS